MAERPADSSVRQMGAAHGNREDPQAEVGEQRWDPARTSSGEAREGLITAAWEDPVAAPRDGRMEAAREGSMAAPREGPMAASREGSAATAAVAREARMAEVARLLAEPAEEEGTESRPRSRSGNGPGLAALPYLRLRHPLSVLGINYQQFLRRYVENYPIALDRIQELGERRRRFVEACRAREAAFDAEYRRNPQRMDFDMLAFTVALSASEVINPLIEELGCDKFINRE
nr:PREDICTED: EP300-interacting inhibitor of differentiation 2-like [Rhinolophus sinicus]